MRSPGEPANASRIVAAIAVIAAIAAGAWWWAHRPSGDRPATRAATEARGSAAASSAPAAALVPGSPAQLIVTVIDDHGPLAGATVRLAPGDGEILVVTTGADGTAHADALEPGAWTVSASAIEHVPAALPAQQLAAGAREALTIKLSAGGRALTGTVVDASGGPIAGARIDAARLTKGVRPGTTVSTTVTGTDGKYRLTVAEGALLVAVASPDYAPQSRVVEVGPAGAVADFSLVPGGVIEGVVRDERTKEPVAAARVVARRDSPATLLAETARRRAVSGPDGRFRLGGLRPGAWEVTATAQARHSKAQTIVGLGVAEQVSDIELLIGAGPVIRGHVVDEAGAPAASAVVHAVTRGNASDATVDAVGAFVLDGLLPGEYVLVGGGEGYLPAGRAQVAFGDQDVDGIIVTVKRGLTITGHVEPRQPCEIQVDTTASAGDLMTISTAASSGADGAFAIGPVRDGHARLSARCASGDQGEVTVQASPGMPDTILKVAPGASIAGRITDGEGKPVAGTGVAASEVSNGDHTVITNGMITSGVHGLTDAAGAYKLEGLAAGSYRVAALDRGRPLRLRSRPPTVALAVNEHRTGVDLVVDRANGAITGTVTGPDGRPLADAWVSAQQDMQSLLGAQRSDPATAGPSGSMTSLIEARDGGQGDAPDSAVPPALSDAQGHYELRGLPHATYIVVAEAQRGQLRARATGIQPDATVDLRALGVTSLTGHVTGPAGPTALFSVDLDGPTRATRSFTDGTYSFARVDPGSYTVRVQSRDGNGQATVTVTPDQPATLDITLAANAVVIGKVVDATGAPVAGQAIALVPDTGGALTIQLDGPAPTTAADGSFRLEHRAERCAVIVLGPPPPISRRGLVLEPGKTLDVGTIRVDAASSGPPKTP